MGEQLALRGIEHVYQAKVGDNHERIVGAMREALARADAVIVCGGLGPTQDDITREAIAEVMGVDLERRAELAEVIRELFASRGRTMPENNLRQADVPVGADPHRAADRHRARADLSGRRRQGDLRGAGRAVRDAGDARTSGAARPRRRAGVRAVIVSRTLRTWGESESGLAEQLAPRFEALDAAGNPTIAFLASGIEGIKVRITARAATDRRRRRRSSTPRRRRSGRSSDASCSPGSTSRWRP